MISAKSSTQTVMRMTDIVNTNQCLQLKGIIAVPNSEYFERTAGIGSGKTHSTGSNKVKGGNGGGGKGNVSSGGAGNQQNPRQKPSSIGIAMDSNGFYKLDCPSMEASKASVELVTDQKAPYGIDYFSTDAKITESSFDLIICLPQMREYQLTERLKHHFASVQSTPLVPQSQQKAEVASVLSNTQCFILVNHMG